MIFIDSGPFLARYVQRDQHHDSAVTHWRTLQQSQRHCFTSNFVLDETITLLARRTNYEFAASRAQSFFASKSLEILRPDARDELSALNLFKKFADQDVSFTDCVSFALMESRGIKCAFSFDHHFRIAGFDIEP